MVRIMEDDVGCEEGIVDHTGDVVKTGSFPGTNVVFLASTTQSTCFWITARFLVLNSGLSNYERE